MHYSNMCGGYCDQPEALDITKEDKKALLEEKQAILEAKLATIRHWIENLDKEKSTENK